MYIALHVKCPAALHSCQILIKLDFLDSFSKNTQISNFVTIRPIEAQRTDGRTDMTKLIVAFRLMMTEMCRA